MTGHQLINGSIGCQVEEYVAGLEPVAARLQAECPDGKFDAKSLAMFIAQLRQFMEDALGLKVGLLGSARRTVVLGKIAVDTVVLWAK